MGLFWKFLLTQVTIKSSLSFSSKTVQIIKWTLCLRSYSNLNSTLTILYGPVSAQPYPKFPLVLILFCILPHKCLKHTRDLVISSSSLKMVESQERQAEGREKQIYFRIPDKGVQKSSGPPCYKIRVLKMLITTRLQNTEVYMGDKFNQRGRMEISEGLSIGCPMNPLTKQYFSRILLYYS